MTTTESMNVLHSEELPGGITIPECPIRRYYSQKVDRTKTSYHRCFEVCAQCYYNK